MRTGFLLLVFAIFSSVVFAQQYPPEWIKYTIGGYLYDIESDINTNDISETKFKEHLLNVARTNLAKQVRLIVQDNSRLNKSAINGKSDISYVSSTVFQVDVELQLVESETYYNRETKEGQVIVYINKAAAAEYYKKEISLLVNNADNALSNAHNYLSSGFKNSAKQELANVLPEFDKVREHFSWLGLLGLSQNEITNLSASFNDREQTIKRFLSDLQYAITIYISCSADIFGNTYDAFPEAIKGELSGKGCNFSDDVSQADWIITVQASARKYNSFVMNNQAFYVAYVDAKISIDKTITSQRICEDELSIKGSHSISFDEAALVAYKNITKKIGEIILKNIEK